MAKFPEVIRKNSEWFVAIILLVCVIGSIGLMAYQGHQKAIYDSTVGCRQQLAALADMPEGYVTKANRCDMSIIVEMGWRVVADISSRRYIVKGHTIYSPPRVIIQMDHETNIEKHW